MTGAGNRILLAGGYRNEVWKVRDGRGWLIEKRYAEDPGDPNPMYPNLPDHEAAALALLGPLGCSPELIDHTPAGGDRPDVLRYRYVSGPMWRRGVADVAALLHRVHHVDVPHGIRRGCRTAVEAVAHGDTMTGDVPAREARELLARRPAAPSHRPPARLSLVHTDCGPGNLVRTRHGLVLIDWQCPVAGTAVEDLACFVSPAMMILYELPPHTAAAREAFLAAYPDRAVVEAYHRDAAAWHYRIAGYCVWRAHRLARRLPQVAERYRRALAAEIDLLDRLA